MPVTYERAKPDHEAHDLIRGLAAKNHPDLAKHEVSIGVLLAASDDGEPSVKLHGYPCAATVRITPYRQRVQGIEDAVITLDRRLWVDLSDERKAALIDHEITHLTVVFDKDGFAKSDDLGRPKLKMRLHDVQAGWFVDIARRHGEHSFEVEQARQIHADHGQLLFAWGDPATVPMQRRKTG